MEGQKFQANAEDSDVVKRESESISKRSLRSIGQENLGEGDNAKLEVQDVDEKQCMILPVHLETLGRMIT
ncbi:hypothetical protein P8452_65057 [Trifolium repens]|nr:hypothetical protein P8452_65057 [Trifolium repens]